jgi:hypothetical protein
MLGDWLRRLSDDQLAEMAAAMTGRAADVERIARERRRLTGALASPL